jgi:hypothetical protein
MLLVEVSVELEAVGCGGDRRNDAAFACCGVQARAESAAILLVFVGQAVRRSFPACDLRRFQ